MEGTRLDEEGKMLHERYVRRERFKAMARMYAETHIAEWNITGREDFTSDMLYIFDQAYDGVQG